MKKELDKIFVDSFFLTPPEGLSEKIMVHIHRAEARHKKRRAVLSILGCIISLIAIIPAAKMAWTGFVNSGLPEYFSLLFSDSGMVMTYWQNFFWTLLEALPTTSLIVLFGTIFMGLQSFTIFLRDRKFLFQS